MSIGELMLMLPLPLLPLLLPLLLLPFWRLEVSCSTSATVSCPSPDKPSSWRTRMTGATEYVNATHATLLLLAETWLRASASPADDVTMK